MFSVVRPVSYLPGAGYFWKYLVPRKLFPLLLLPRPPVPKTGSGILLCAGVCPAAELRQLGYLPTLREPPWQASFLRRTAKTIVGLSLMELNLQMARGGWRSRAALISAAHPSARELIEPFPNTASPSLAGALETPTDASRLPMVKKDRGATALAAVQERSVPRPRCATPLRGEDA